MNPDLPSDNAIIDALGGTTKTAAIFEIVPQAVSRWRRNGIPPTQRKYLRLLRPEVFAAEGATEPAAQPGMGR